MATRKKRGKRKTKRKTKRKSTKRSRSAKAAWKRRRAGGSDSTAAFMSAANKRGHSHYVVDDVAAQMASANKRGHHVHVHVAPRAKKKAKH